MVVPFFIISTSTNLSGQRRRHDERVELHKLRQVGGLTKDDKSFKIIFSLKIGLSCPHRKRALSAGRMERHDTNDGQLVRLKWNARTHNNEQRSGFAFGTLPSVLYLLANLTIGPVSNWLSMISGGVMISSWWSCLEQLRKDKAKIEMMRQCELLTVSNWRCGNVSNLDAWVANANVGFWDAWVWRVDGLRVVRNLLQVSVRSQHVLLLAGDGRSDNGLSVVVSNSSIAHGNCGQKTHELNTTWKYTKCEHKLWRLPPKGSTRWISNSICGESENVCTHSEHFSLLAFWVLIKVGM